MSIMSYLVAAAGGVVATAGIVVTAPVIPSVAVVATIVAANFDMEVIDDILKKRQYMNKRCSKKISVNNTSSSNNSHSFDLTESQRVKDFDLTEIIIVSLEDIFHGTERDVIVQRKILNIDKRTPEIEEAKYTIIIEPGCADRKTFRFIEAVHRNPINIPGDLIVEIRTEQHQLYERSGSDLIYKAKVSLEDALRGTPVQVPLIDGGIEEFNPRDVINPNTQTIIDQAGLPDPANGGIRGRLIVKFDIKFPDTKLGTEPIEPHIHNENLQ